MKKKKIIIWLTILLIFCSLSGLLGYIAGYFVEGLTYANEKVVETYCQILELDSIVICNSDNVSDLLVKLERNYDNYSGLIKNNLQISSGQLKEKTEKTLIKWKEAKAKLNSLQQSVEPDCHSKN